MEDLQPQSLWEEGAEIQVDNRSVVSQKHGDGGRVICVRATLNVPIGGPEEQLWHGGGRSQVTAG